jgi:hypothetical protein
MIKEIIQTLQFARCTLVSVQNTRNQHLPVGVLNDIHHSIRQIDDTLKRVHAERIATAILEREHGPGAVDALKLQRGTELVLKELW